jgi:phosphoribosyl 1,2-cyclic phosphodiesterase
MKITFYGARGSFPVCNPNVIEFGGNTSCILIETIGGTKIIIDAGTGIRNLGNDLIKDEKSKEIILLLTHFHWDHIQGWPFFLPAYRTRFNITIASLDTKRNAKKTRELIAGQMSNDYWPVTIDQMNANINFVEWPTIKEKLSQFELENIQLNHPGGSSGLKIKDVDGKVAAFVVDHEHGKSIDPKYIDFCKEADLLIHDAHYTDEELIKYAGWGHSTFNQAVELAQLANVRQLIMTHHDPEHSDEFLSNEETECQQRLTNCLLAKEGMSVEI